MKKSLIAVLAVSMIMTQLTGCGSSAAPATAPAAAAPAAEATTAAPAKETPAPTTAAQAAPAAETAAVEAAAAETTAAEAAAPADLSSVTDKTYEIKMCSSLASTDPTIIAFEEVNDKIREATGGKLDIQMYADGQMLLGAEGIEALRTGSAVIIVNDPMTLLDYVPVYNTICAPYLYDSYKDIEAFSKTDTWADIMKQGDEAGFHLIAATCQFGARSILADGIELHSVDDCKGLNIRIPNEILHTTLFGAWGANYTATSWNEGVTGIETGMLNAIESQPQRLVSTKVYELMDNPVFSEVKYLVSPTCLQINNDYWMSIPQEWRDFVTESYTTAFHEINLRAAADEEGYIQQMADEGVKIIRADEIDLDGFRAAASLVGAKMERYDEIKAAVEAVKAKQ